MFSSSSLFFFFLLTKLFSRGKAWSVARLPANLTNDMSLDPSLGQCPVSNNRLGPSWPISSPLSVELGQWKAPGDFCSSELTDGRTEREGRGKQKECVHVWLCVVCVKERESVWGTWPEFPNTIETSSLKRLASFELAVGDKSLHLKVTNGRIPLLLEEIKRKPNCQTDRV